MDGQVLLNGLTAALAVATVWLAVETRRMASAAKAQIALQARPYLAFTGIDFGEARIASVSTGRISTGLSPRLRLLNPGKVLIDYAIRTAKISVDEQTIFEMPKPSGRTPVHPSENVQFLLPHVLLDEVVGKKLAIAFEAEFGTELERHLYQASVVVTLLGVNPTSWDWVCVGSPKYTAITPATRG